MRQPEHSCKSICLNPSIAIMLSTRYINAVYPGNQYTIYHTFKGNPILKFID